MAFVGRSALGVSRVNTLRRARGITPHSFISSQTSWQHPAISVPSQSRRYHGGNNGSNPNWDGIVYHFMDNLQGKVKHGPECFIRDDDSEEGTKRDMRDEVPLKLDRPWLRHTAEAIDIRLQILAGNMDDTDEWEAMKKLIRLLERLANAAEDNVRLSMEEYKEIWDTIRAANNAEAEIPITLFSVAEKTEMQRIMAIGGAIYRSASCNAALRGIRGDKIEKEEGDEAEEPPRDLNALAMNIYGGLLDGKDFFGDKKWFTIEEDKEMLRSINQLRAESRKRG